MKIYDFTQPELRFFRENCNFTEDETILFEHRSKGVPLEECAERMNVSLATAKRLSKRVNNKIIRVC